MPALAASISAEPGSPAIERMLEAGRQRGTAVETVTVGNHRLGIAGDERLPGGAGLVAEEGWAAYLVGAIYNLDRLGGGDASGAEATLR
ncbi:MAG: hypothetical protein ACRDVM_04845, partial [Acidimicrobiia bacterium]